MLNKEIRGAVLTAVHGELMSKDARRRNVSISGLPSKPGISDMALVDELVETEFGYRPLIACTRRLERVVSGRVQPIAVTYADIKDAEYLVDHARLLWDSNNTSLRQSVYINRDMTRTEVQVAFDLCNQQLSSSQGHASTLVTAQVHYVHSA